MTFNVEEMYLIQELDHRTRRKPKAMTDRQFAEIDFTAVKEDAEHE